MFAAMNSGENFKPSDYGTVLFADTGQIPQEVMDAMRDKYGMLDIPMPPPVRYPRMSGA
jgi:hypothetical protein